MTQCSFRMSLLSALLVISATPARAGMVSCSLQCDLPADIEVPTSDADDSTLQGFGWQTFLGLNAPSVGGQISTTGDNVPQWASCSGGLQQSQLPELSAVRSHPLRAGKVPIVKLGAGMA